MHNNIMAVGSKDRPPMLGPGRYSQWRSRFLRYIDTKPNGEGLRKSILSGPYVPSTVLVQALGATEGFGHSIQIELDCDCDLEFLEIIRPHLILHHLVMDRHLCYTCEEYMNQRFAGALAPL
ncbi:hypothetical protein Tco_0456314 [Tanacetum coccineum]